MFTEDHEVLCKDGNWKNITELVEGDCVATLRGFDKIEYVPIKECRVEDAITQVYHIVLSNADVRVTKDHSVYVDIYDDKKGTWDGYSYYKPEEILGKIYAYRHHMEYGIVNEEEDPGVEKIIQYQGKTIFIELMDTVSDLILLRHNNKAVWVPICEDNIHTEP